MSISINGIVGRYQGCYVGARDDTKKIQTALNHPDIVAYRQSAFRQRWPAKKPELKADSICGVRTVGAIESFQDQIKYPVGGPDGWIGSTGKTLKKLNAYQGRGGAVAAFTEELEPPTLPSPVASQVSSGPRARCAPLNFDRLWHVFRAYCCGGQEEMMPRIGFAEDSWITQATKGNSCAVRMTFALNKAGCRIPYNFGLPVKVNPVTKRKEARTVALTSSLTGGATYHIGFGVRDLYDWFCGRYGKPNIIAHKARDFAGQRGIVRFKHRASEDRTGAGGLGHWDIVDATEVPPWRWQQPVSEAAPEMRVCFYEYSLEDPRWKMPHNGAFMWVLA